MPEARTEIYLAYDKSLKSRYAFFYIISINAICFIYFSCNLINFVIDALTRGLLLAYYSMYGLSDGITYTMQEIADKYYITQNYAKYLLRRGLGKLARSEELKNLYGKTKPKSTARKNKTVQTAMKLQFKGREFDIEETRKAVEADCKAKNYTPVTALEIYIKPEDHAAYYVVNSEIADKIEL